ncbi:MAG: hypothetical protein FD149_2466, partial [Rhodospirillaceae bacterium]
MIMTTKRISAQPTPTGDVDLLVVTNTEEWYRGQTLHLSRGQTENLVSEPVMPVIAFDGESWISPLRIRDRGTVHGQERDCG